MPVLYRMSFYFKDCVLGKFEEISEEVAFIRYSLVILKIISSWKI